MTTSDPRISTGNSGLDAILGGGLTPSRLYLLEGAPGSGKTTLGLQFLMEGVARGERCLYITLSETQEELSAVVASHDWTLDGIDIFELSAAEEVLGDGRGQTIIHPWEIELSATVDLIIKFVDETQPSRLVFDSLSELRLLSQDPLRYRRQVLALKQYFAGKNITVILVDDLTGEHGERDAHLHSISHGVITLSRTTLDFGAARRSLEVQKMRGVQFAAGFHDVVIEKGGLQVYPRLIAADFHTPFVGEPVSSGIAEMDALLGGGPLRGTSAVLTGPAGSGKARLPSPMRSRRVAGARTRPSTSLTSASVRSWRDPGRLAKTPTARSIRAGCGSSRSIRQRSAPGNLPGWSARRSKSAASRF